MLRKLIILFFLSVCVKCQLLNKEEGSKCEWKGNKGTCVLIYKCQSAIESLKTRDYAPICSFQGKDPIICCTDCKFVDDIRTMVFNPQAGMLYLTGQKAHDNCIVNFVDKLDYECKSRQTAEITKTLHPKKNCFEYGENRTGFIERGVDPKPPKTQIYLALLGYGEDIKTAQWLCAGAIISEKFILTAAHCLTLDKVGQVRFVALGVLKRSDPVDNWQTHKVKKVIPYPEYQPPSKYHDIGLIELETTITFSNKVLPACILNVNYGSHVTYAVVWDSEGDDRDTLKLAALTHKYEDQCEILYPPQDNLVNGFNITTQLCPGNDEQPTDSCQSYSGSPLLAEFQEANCAPIIYGVTAIDRTCGSYGSSGLFTEVYYYTPWIETNVWP